MADHPEDTAGLLRRARRGDLQAPGELFARHRERLRRMVQVRLDRRLQGRIDPSDVLQDAYLEVARSLPEYLKDPAAPFFLWLRCITARRLHALHRRHLATAGRDAGREVSIHGAPLPAADSASLAARLLGRHTTPSQAAARAELRLRVQEALEALGPIDREVLALRHFEQLTNIEAAQVLGVSEAAASNRFVRALRRLKGVLQTMPGVAGEWAGLAPDGSAPG